jgi:hypothetical protein
MTPLMHRLNPDVPLQALRMYEPMMRRTVVTTLAKHKNREATVFTDAVTQIVERLTSRPIDLTPESATRARVRPTRGRA